jgi:hypothetical protein
MDSEFSLEVSSIQIFKIEILCAFFHLPHYLPVTFSVIWSP